MRLLTTEGDVPRLEDFNGPAHAPSYAILSHRWYDKEVTYQDMLKPDFDPEASGKSASWETIQNCRRVARELDYSHVWIDTCNINKESSAELSECINSMYAWYKQSGLCIAFLSDVDTVSDLTASECKVVLAGVVDSWRPLINLRVHTRLDLARTHRAGTIGFLFETWAFRGFRSGLARQIAKETRIDANVLRGTPGHHLRSHSVAQRLSWAAFRETSREEDEAYCLFGLFDIGLPALYGEGAYKAFSRLQFAVFSSTGDHSIFAWHSEPGNSSDSTTDMFAPDPKSFFYCSRISPAPYSYMIPSKTRRTDEERVQIDSGYSPLSHGLRVQFRVAFNSHKKSSTDDQKYGHGANDWVGSCVLACSDARAPGCHLAIQVASTQPGHLRRVMGEKATPIESSLLPTFDQADFFLIQPSFVEPGDSYGFNNKFMIDRYSERPFVAGICDGVMIGACINRQINSSGSINTTPTRWHSRHEAHDQVKIRAQYTISSDLAFTLSFDLPSYGTMDKGRLALALLTSPEDSPRTDVSRSSTLSPTKKTLTLDLPFKFVVWATHQYIHDKKSQEITLNIELRALVT